MVLSLTVKLLGDTHSTIYPEISPQFFVLTGFTLIIQADNQDYSGKGESFQPETFELIQLPELVVYTFEVFNAG